MLCWIDRDSGTYGVGEDNIVFVDMTDAQEEDFAALADDERIGIARQVQSFGISFAEALCNAKGWHDSGDNPVNEWNEAECEHCGAMVNAVPD